MGKISVIPPYYYDYCDYYDYCVRHFFYYIHSTYWRYDRRKLFYSPKS